MEGWICPQCGRGVSPHEKHCDHGDGWHPEVNRYAYVPTTCAACRESGICNCYRPAHSGASYLLGGAPLNWLVR